MGTAVETAAGEAPEAMAEEMEAGAAGWGCVHQEGPEGTGAREAQAAQEG